MAGSHLSLLSFLDPREIPDPPWIDAVCIPLSDLADRVAELPPPGEPVRVLGDPHLFGRAQDLLASLGRVALAAGPGRPCEKPERGRLWRPNPWLAQCVEGIAPGRALDMGCGGGREAVFLAAEGWSVLAVDRLPDALTRGAALAARALDAEVACKIEWQAMDLTRSTPDGPFNLVYALYWFDREALRSAAHKLTPGGRLVVEAFTDAHFKATGRPTSPERRARAGELKGLMADLDYLGGDEGARGDRHSARAAWQAKGQRHGDSGLDRKGMRARPC